MDYNTLVTPDICDNDYIMFQDCSCDKFHELIRIANPDICNELSGYDFKTQLLVSQFTRIFNIEQILYILKQYKPLIDDADRFICMMGRKLSLLKSEFENQYQSSYFDGMDVYSLMISELECDFAKAKGYPVKFQIYKICMYACQIEKEFQYRDFEFKKLAIQNSKTLPSIRVKKYKHMQDIIKKQKKLWNRFEEQYNNFLKKESGLKSEIKTNDDIDSIKLFVHQKNIEPITITAHGMKNTFSFYRYARKNKDLQASKNFMTLFPVYAKEMDLKHGNLTMVSGHIQYFRLLNIIKIMFLCNEYGIECRYNNIDIFEILSAPIAAACDIANDFANMTSETLFNLLDRDALIIAGIKDISEDTRMIPFLFCYYLDIEKCWISFDAFKFNASAIDFVDKSVAKKLTSDAVTVTMFFNMFSEKTGYHEIIHELDGKIIDFPA